MTGAGPSGSSSFDFDPSFKLVLLIVTGLTAVSFVTMVLLAITGATNAQADNLSALCTDAFKVGFGAIVGLLGGKKL